VDNGGEETRIKIGTTVIIGRITLERRAEDWLAFLDGDQSLHGAGATQHEAVGKLMLTHQDAWANGGVPVALFERMAERFDRSFERQMALKEALRQMLGIAVWAQERVPDTLAEHYGDAAGDIAHAQRLLGNR
jgi:hypothetical protein